MSVAAVPNEEYVTQSECEFVRGLSGSEQWYASDFQRIWLGRCFKQISSDEWYDQAYGAYLDVRKDFARRIGWIKRRSHLYFGENMEVKAIAAGEEFRRELDKLLRTKRSIRTAFRRRNTTVINVVITKHLMNARINAARLQRARVAGMRSKRGIENCTGLSDRYKIHDREGPWHSLKRDPNVAHTKGALDAHTHD